MMIALAIIAVVVIIACVVLIGKWRSPEAIGARGENRVAKILGDTIAGQQYVINNLLFTDASGRSCQIDHVFINRFGIWVIETKNYAGQIYGEENQREWTQVLAYGNTKNKFYNPIKQNITHIYRLSEVLKVKPSYFHNIVVFSERSDISNITSGNVISIHQLKSIKFRDTGIVLSMETMEYCYNRLRELQENSHVSKEEHINQIHDMQANINRGICPRCGAKLVLRNGQNGEFYGCSNYPRCKFTKNI